MNLVENYESRYQTDEKTENKKTNKYNCSLDIHMFSKFTYTVWEFLDFSYIHTFREINV